MSLHSWIHVFKSLTFIENAKRALKPFPITVLRHNGRIWCKSYARLAWFRHWRNCSHADYHGCDLTFECNLEIVSFLSSLWICSSGNHCKRPTGALINLMHLHVKQNTVISIVLDIIQVSIVCHLCFFFVRTKMETVPFITLLLEMNPASLNSYSAGEPTLTPVINADRHHCT